MRDRHSTAACRRAARVLAMLLGLIGALLAPGPVSAAQAAPSTSAIEHAAVASLPTKLRGVNRSGTEFMCVQNRGIFDGPADNASIQAIKNWRANVVRVPLNEDCWLGINGANPAYSGANYRDAISDYVSRLRQAGLYVILELHWSSGLHIGIGSNCWAYASRCQKPMPNSDHTPDFWKSVANTFKSDQAVVFDLFNEPFPNLLMFDAKASWRCWRDGGSACIGFLYPVAGMQTLVNAVRSTGATNYIMVGGINYANDLSGWLTYAPSDPEGKLVASWHSYNFNSCNTQSCWDSQIAPVATRYPLVVGEIGEDDCAHAYVDTLMNWLDSRDLGYLGWTWNTWDCKSGPSLITDYDGTPTAYGQGLKNRLASG
ncbi:cellulase family glycosylhydrolase [Streptomyces sp. NPDC001137]|uniref:glycoside hydrolase family 5 protein n=1 Tax=Streptomyces sp. NPDC001137 TaxID=3154378 RepID=UPI00332EB997